MDELIKKAKNIDVEEVKDNIQLKISEIQDELQDLDKEKVLKIAQEKGEQIKDKCQELVQYAIDKGTPVLEKAANEVREKAIDVVKEILAKLEKQDKKSK